MAERVTIQDIADALGVSRNTVSKAINNTGILADATRERVLRKAAEMGYKQFSYVMLTNVKQAEQTQVEPGSAGEIALLTTFFMGNSHFSSTMLDKFQRELQQLGYTLSMHRILAEEVEARRLPSSLNMERTAGIICFEVFDYPYAKMLCELGIPILFVDTPVCVCEEPLKADQLYMDNQANLYQFVGEMARRGKKRIGFIGDRMHCQSFYERYTAYRNALDAFGLPYIQEYCISGNKAGVKHPSSADFIDYLADHVQTMKTLPDVFICANDFIALDALNVLRRFGYSVPGDVYLCGFDDSPESRVVTPSLTTIHIHSQIMGVTAVYLLMSRIKEPSLNYRTIHTETSLIYRQSTGD